MLKVSNPVGEAVFIGIGVVKICASAEFIKIYKSITIGIKDCIGWIVRV